MVPECNFSLIIPTYNRHQYLHRLLTYYNKHEIEYQIIIADSSTKGKKSLNEKTISAFPKLNIKYLSFPDDIYPIRKFQEAINSVITKYCVICADDDFITPISIKKCIMFLEENPDYAAVGGYYFNFIALKTNCKRKKFFWKKYLSHTKNIESYMTIKSSNPMERLEIHLSNYFPTLYYIHQTDFLKMIYKITLENTDDVRFSELLLDMLTVIYGKIQTLDILYGVRETIITSSTSTYSKMLHFIDSGSYDEKYQKFEDCLVEHLLKNQEIHLQEANEIVRKGMNTYFQTRIVANKKTSSCRIKQILIRILVIIRKLRINIFQYHKISFKKRYDLKKWNINDPPEKYLNDFNDIKETVLQIL